MSGRIITVVLFVLLGSFLYSSRVLAATDSDTDGLSDEMEQLFGTNSTLVDTDGDGFTDFEEVKNGFSPLVKEATALESKDTDGDKLLDWQEQLFGTDIHTVDTDGDGFTDYDEILFGYLPTDVSTSTKLSRKIFVDLTKQQLHYVINDVRILTMPISSGNPATPTPVGEFQIQRKVPVIRYTGVNYDYKNVKWNLQFLPHYYLHTAYWHNDFGKRTRSHGCVNMREADAGILYKYVSVGVPVVVGGTTPKHLYVGK